MSADSTIETPVPSRFVVGIDLGTTNSAVCYVDTQPENLQVQSFAIPQIVAPGQIESRKTLPSFDYQAVEEEFADSALAMPWENEKTSAAVGAFAREQGKLVPDRVTESAKSWLCHPGVDRTSSLLPWHGSADIEMFSPVEVSAKYLSHIRDAWNVEHADALLEDQDIVLTVPASFDEVARELTVDAAKLSGLDRLFLNEEPLAALYAWLNSHQENWQEFVTPGQTILVCDIGGGFSDFTLIQVKPNENGEAEFHRVAVGDQLVLGGDNLDLALARHLEKKLNQDAPLTPRQWGSLVQICRHAKETLLSPDPPETYTISLSAGDPESIDGGLQTELTRDEVQELLLSEFFPKVGLDERPRQVQSEIQKFGLPYASDAAVTRHLAAFLSDHSRNNERQTREATRPDVVLFNGGVLQSPLIQDRIVHQIERWFRSADENWSPRVLENKEHDLAVARGAACYGMVRRGNGVCIEARLPRTFYLGVGVEEKGKPKLKALTLMPAGAEPGFETTLDDFEFDLTIATPVQFPIFSSSTRLTDPTGAIVDVKRGQMTALPPIRTVLQPREEKDAASVPVITHAKLNDFGTLQLWCSEATGDRKWQFQFDVRSTTQTDLTGRQGQGEAAQVLEPQVLEVAATVLRKSFGKKASEKPSGIAKRMARTLHLSKEDWPPSLLRRMWRELMDYEESRNLSADHEARWLNLLGFSLRPGFGVAMDDWRVSETWDNLHGKLKFTGSTSLMEWWILWRRVAGGLTAEQQQSLALQLVASIKDKVKRSLLATEADEEGNKGRRRHRSRETPEELSESWRMLGSFERLPLKMKIEIADSALATLAFPESKAILPALLWTIGRVGSRQPFYGSLSGVVPTEKVAGWIDQLLDVHKSSHDRRFALVQLARKTGDRYRDIDESQRSRVVTWLHEQKTSAHFIELVEKGGQLGSRERDMTFGESLPQGLI